MRGGGEARARAGAWTAVGGRLSEDGCRRKAKSGCRRKAKSGCRRKAVRDRKERLSEGGEQGQDGRVERGKEEDEFGGGKA